jgi:four helix bundle protein
MDKQELKKRTKDFALRIIKLTQALPKNDVGRVIGNQLLRAGTAVAANYRAACRARSKPEFIAKIGIVVEESDECCLWLELIIESGLMKESAVASLLKEASEITAIMFSTRNSTIKNK